MPYKDPEDRRANDRIHYAAHREEVRAYQRAYYAMRREKATAYRAIHRKEIAAYREAHRDDARAASRAYIEAHLEERRAASRAYYAANLDERRAYSRAYRAAHPQEVISCHAAYSKAHPQENAEKERRHRAIKRNATVGPIDLEAIKARDRMVCAICGKRVVEKDLSFDHTVPLSLGGPHSQENLRVAHRRCNYRRGAGRLPVQMVLV